MTTLYKLLAGLGLILVLAVLSYFYGHTQGAASAKAHYETAIATLNQQSADALEAANRINAARLAAVQKSSQEAVQAATAQSLSDTQALATLQQRLKSYENVPADKLWLGTKLPPDIAGLLAAAHH